MGTVHARRLAGLITVATMLGGILDSAISANELFWAVGWYGEFTQIDATTGEVAPTRTDLPDDLQALAWSPNGVLFAGCEDKLYTLDLAAGDAALFLWLDGIDVCGMAFSASGDLYTTGRNPEGSATVPDDSLFTLGIIDIKDRTWRNVGNLWGDVDVCQGLAFSPDGTLYGVAPHDDMGGTYDLFTIDLDDGETHLIVSCSGTDLSQSLAFAPDGRLYALGQATDARGAAVSSFARLDPRDGRIIGPVITFPGDYRGLELVPEPATVLLLGLGGFALVSWRKQTRRG